MITSKPSKDAHFAPSQSDQIKRRIEENTEARRSAETICGLAEYEAAKHGGRFWDCLARMISKHTSPKEEIKRLGPMSDQETKAFGSERMPFGEFAGKRIDDIPLDRLRWYADQIFIDELRRYLESDRVKGEDHGES